MQWGYSGPAKGGCPDSPGLYPMKEGYGRGIRRHGKERKNLPRRQGLRIWRGVAYVLWVSRESTLPSVLQASRSRTADHCLETLSYTTDRSFSKFPTLLPIRYVENDAGFQKKFPQKLKNIAKAVFSCYNGAIKAGTGDRFRSFSLPGALLFLPREIQKAVRWDGAKETFL